MKLSIGQKVTKSITVTADHVKKFTEISGDYNPLHFDESFAAKTKFKRLVAQGGLTTGLLHALVAMDMFTAPVFIDDTNRGEAEVISIHETKPVTQLKIKITRQDGETVLEGEAWCYTFPAD
jgi:acyl dehydratase